MRYISCFCILVLLVAAVASCKKDMMEMKAPVATIDSVASYKIIISGTWRSPQHTVPAGEHFTPFIGMVHGKDSYIFKLGTQASTGVKNVAEVGYGATLQNEIDSYITSGKALNRFQVALPGVAATDSVTINLSSQQSLVSFESMIAPSPDWFVGLDSYDLIQDSKWVKDITINALGYDAGTEDGDVFGYANPATMPQQNVSYLTPANASVIANRNTAIAPFATVRFIRQK